MTRWPTCADIEAAAADEAWQGLDARRQELATALPAAIEALTAAIAELS